MGRMTICGIAVFTFVPVMHEIVLFCIIGIIGVIDPITHRQYEMSGFIETHMFPVSAFSAFDAVVTYITTFVA